MLQTEKILNEFGLTIEEAETILQSNVFSTLQALQDASGPSLGLQVNALDDNIVLYLSKPSVQAILEENRKEPIVVSSSGADLDVPVIDLGDFDIDIPDMDIRVVDSDAPVAPPKAKADEETPDVPEPEVKKIMARGIEFKGVPASTFFLEVLGDKLPMVDSNGALTADLGSVVVTGSYEVSLAGVGAMDLSDELMTIRFASLDADALSDATPESLNGVGGIAIDVDPAELSLKTDEISKFYETQQYLVGGKQVNTSFASISASLDTLDLELKLDDETQVKRDERIVFPVGKGLDPEATWRSNFVIAPKSLYALANCEDFFQVSVASYNYITNYCEGNDLEHLRIFEVGGDHLNVPYNNTPNVTISSRKITNDAFSARVDNLVASAVEGNGKLIQVGFTPNLPKEVGYSETDNVTKLGGYMVYVNPLTTTTFYIPALIVNYFDKYYNLTHLTAGTNAFKRHYTIFFKGGDSTLGFMMLKEKHCIAASPARLLGENPVKARAENKARYATMYEAKTDIESYYGITAQFLGNVVEPPKVERPQEEAKEEKGKSPLETFMEQRDATEQMLELLSMTDAAESTLEALRAEIETLNYFIDLQGPQPDTEASDAPSEPEVDTEAIDIVDTSEADLELGDMAIGNEQEVVPTPSANDPIVEDITDAQVEAIETSDDPEMGDQIDADITEVSTDDLDIDVDFAKGGTTRNYTIHLSKDLGLDDEFKYHVFANGKVVGCNTKKECQEVIALAKQGSIEFAEGGRPNPTKHIKVYYSEDNGYGHFSSEEVIESSKDVEEVREKWKSIMIGNPDIGSYQIVEVKSDGSERKVPSKFHGFATGGQLTGTLEEARKAVKAMSDDDVAKTLVDVIFSSLDSMEYDTTEEEALVEARKDIEHSRDLLVKILKEASTKA